MFRCITELKGLVIDIESFSDIEMQSWEDLLKKYKCLFFVSNEEIYQEITKCYGKEVTYKVEKYKKLFAPNKITHEEALHILDLRPTEMGYVSTSSIFLERAMGFFGAAIWVTDKVTYEEASKAPDLICKGFDTFKKLMWDNVGGFFGEVIVFPNRENKGMTIPVEFEVDGNKVPLYMLGRYFGSLHYMNQLAPYSTAILLNKKEGRTYYRKFDEIFANLYIQVIKRIQKSKELDGVVSVPSRPKRENRFDKILEMISQSCNIKNFGDDFICMKDYPAQKNTAFLEKKENVSGVFHCKEILYGKNIVIIDDIITTGATIAECVRTLKKAGIHHIFIVILGINQMQGNYWSSDVIEVKCPKCNEKMSLLINGKNKSFFYKCNGCNKTLDFKDGRKMLYDTINSKIVK